MRSARFLGFLSLACCLVACGSEDVDPGTQVARDSLSWESGPFEVPAGESFECFYTDMITDRELSVISAAAEQAAGGHHVTVYYVDNERPVGHANCSGTTEMADWHFVVGAGGEGNQLGDFAQLAEGLAIKIPAGKQLMVQTHYINTTGTPQVNNDKLLIKLIEPAEVKAYAADFVILNDGFEIPPNASLTSSTVCTVQADVQLTMLLGHMHEHGQQYTLEIVDELGETKETLYDEAWKPDFSSHPPALLYTMNDPLILRGGTRLRQTCTWHNNSADVLLFPTEMCIGFGYYFPGNDRIMCEEP